MTPGTRQLLIYRCWPIWTGPIGDPQRATVSGAGTWAVGEVSGSDALGNGVSWLTGIYAILGQWGATLRTG